jgi:hypothetical protein
MNKEFEPHPVIANYKASRDGIIRHYRQKKPVGRDNGMRYLVFTVGGKNILIRESHMNVTTD